MLNIFFVIGVMIINTLIGATGSLFLKKGAAKFHLHIRAGIIKLIMDTLKNWEIILGVSLYFISSIFFLYLLKTEELSLLYPITALSYVFVTVLSVYVLKEKINKFKLFGIVLIIFGVILVTI